MPRIPTEAYPSATPTTDSPNAQQDIRQAGQTAREIQTVGQEVTGLGDKFQKLRDEQEITSAKVALSKSINEIHVKALTDPDVWGQTGKLDEQYQQAAAEAGSRISSTFAKQQFQDESQISVERGRTKLTTALMNRQSQLYKGTYTDRLDQLANEYSTALPQEQATIKQEMMLERNKAVSVAGVHPDWADLHLKKIMQDLPGRTLKSDLGAADTAPDSLKQIQAIENELKKGEFGKYSDLAPQKKDAAFKAVEDAKKRAEKTAPERVKQVQMIADKKMTDRYMKGTLGEEDLLKNQNTMSKERYDLLSKNIISGNLNYVRQNDRTEFSRTVDFIADPKNSEDTIVNKIIAAENKGKLTPNEAKGLVQMFMVSPDEDPGFKLPRRPNLPQMLQAREEKDRAFKQNQERAKTWWGQLQNHFGNNTKGAEDAAKEIVKKYNSEPNKEVKNADGWGRSQAAALSAQDILKNYPGVSAFPKEGVVKLDRFGNRLRVFPDGNYTVEKKDNG